MLFLVSRLFIKMPPMPIRPVTANMMTVFKKLPSESVAPAQVEVMTDGILEKVAITRNLKKPISVKGAKYTRMSFGVPGMKNRSSIPSARIVEGNKCEFSCI